MPVEEAQEDQTPDVGSEDQPQAARQGGNDANEAEGDRGPHDDGSGGTEEGHA